MGSLEKRVAELEEQFARPAPGEVPDEPRPEAVEKYDAALEKYRAALRAAKAVNPGSSRVPSTPELEAANDELLRARGELRAFSQELWEREER